MKLLIITQKVDEDDVALSFFISWLKRFSQKLDRLYVVCMWEGKHDQIGDNVKILSLGKEKGTPKLKQLFYFYKYSFGLIKDVDAVFVHMNPIWVILGWPIFKLSKKNVSLWYAHKSVTLKLKLAHLLADKIFSTSTLSFRIKSQKAVFTGHGIDTNLFKPSLEGYKSNTVLSVGRITPSKDQETLIRAADYIVNKKEIKNINFIIVGGPAVSSDYEYYEKIKNLIKDLNLNDYVNIKGKVTHNDLPLIYREAKICVNNSLTGSIDKDVLEAAASGCLVLTSNEAFEDQLGSRYLFEKGNHIELGDKIIDFLDKQPDPELRGLILRKHNLDNLIASILKEIGNLKS